MPSDQRKVKRRNRSRSRVAKVARLKKATSEAAASELNPESSHPGHEAAMGNGPRPGWRASLHGFRAQAHRSVTNMCLNKRFWLFTLSICILLLVYYYMYPEFPNVPQIGWSRKNNEDASGQSLGKDFALEALLNFFFPTTCIVRENRVVKACNELHELNESECLRQKCCFSSSGTGRFKCFAPLRDEPKQMMRMCGVGVVSLVSLGYLSFYCCSLCCRRKRANYLQGNVKNVEKSLKKQRSGRRRKKEQKGAGGDEKDDEE
ncbi:fragile X mental retardation 1 neighbor protein [Sapajus apella]|uniref:Fragile X mental retardation 1 neighbor protein n=1 Tax=Sapajus apella TaxID=9515 RepID=A0A6J3G3J2_SAPAP|nr:fragile X mental retardation 1 neighbor protein [Sapajus apella]